MSGHWIKNHIGEHHCEWGSTDDFIEHLAQDGDMWQCDCGKTWKYTIRSARALIGRPVDRWIEIKAPVSSSG